MRDRLNVNEIAEIASIVVRLDKSRLLLLKCNADVLLAHQEIEMSKKEQLPQKEAEPAK